MSLTAESMTPADIYACTGNRDNGWGGDGAWWLLVLFLFAMNGWGGFGGFGGNNAGAVPYINNDVQRGFDQSAVMSGINGLQNTVVGGFGDIQTALCGGFAGVNAGVANGFAQAEIANNARQIANMNQAFASQTAITGGMNTIASQLQNCCCENRAGIADLKYTVATEACADRSAISDALRDVIASNTANTQAILDKLCQQEIDTLKTQNANLQTQVNLANMQASQTAQTSRILADNAAQTQALEQYLNPAPIPAYVVQNPNCCAQYNGCGCGM